MAAFATVAELETHLGTSGLGSRGTAMLATASAQIRLFCAQDLDVVTGRQVTYAGDPWRFRIELTQTPVTAVSAITIDAVAFTDFTWTKWGHITRNDVLAWEDGPILITYDSGWASDSDEIAGVKGICLDIAGRAMTGNPNTFGLEVQELRGPAPAVFLTDEEKSFLSGFASVAMA